MCYVFLSWLITCENTFTEILYEMELMVVEMLEVQ